MLHSHESQHEIYSNNATGSSTSNNEVAYRDHVYVSSPFSSSAPRIIVSSSSTAASKRLVCMIVVLTLCIESILRIPILINIVSTNGNDNRRTHGTDNGNNNIESSQGIDTEEEQQTSVSSESSSSVVFDIISIGSIHQSDLQDAQEQTFGQHMNIRTFYRINEYNDTDTNCHSTLTQTQFDHIVNICTTTTSSSARTSTNAAVEQRRRGGGSRSSSEHNSDTEQQQPSYISSNVFQDQVLFGPKHSIGWLCAQKRPIDGLYRVLQQYKIDVQSDDNNDAPTTSIPNYLIVSDDDTYINMDYMINNLIHRYDYNKNFILTGCLLYPTTSESFHLLKAINFYFPYGGYGTILTRKSIQRLLQPIFCNSSSDTSARDHNSRYYDNADEKSKIDQHYNYMVCKRLQQNLIGENNYYRNGMSVLDIMYQYTSLLSFTQSQDWGTNGTGYCFHSDHTLAYFFSYYYIGVPDSKWLSMIDKAKANDQPNESNQAYSVAAQQQQWLYNDITNDTTKEDDERFRVQYGYQEIMVSKKLSCTNSIFGRMYAKYGICTSTIDPFCHKLSAKDFYRIHNRTATTTTITNNKDNGRHRRLRASETFDR